MSFSDLELAEILAARLCHELVSPIGAIANGMEILADEPDFAAEARDLIAQSTRQAACRLQYYRLAYGSVGGIPDTLARMTALAFFADGKVSCAWREGGTLATGHAKLALNLLLVAAECLPRGGDVFLDVGNGLKIRAEGEGARLTEAAEAVFAKTPEEDITPRSVQSVFCSRLARRLGLRIEAQTGPASTVSFLAVC